MSSRFSKIFRRLSGRLHALERRMGIRPELELKTLLTAPDFRQELARQRAYAERAGTSLLLLRFSLAPSFPESEDREEAMETLADAVRARMRLSDIAGRCDDPAGGVQLILRCARPEGIAGIAREVAEGFGRRMPRTVTSDAHARHLSCEIVSYPCSDAGPSGNLLQSPEVSAEEGP